MDIPEIAARLGLTACLAFDPAVLAPSETVRGYCRANRCGTYGRNYMCPPYCGTLEKIAGKLADYTGAWLLQYSVPLDVKHDRPGVEAAKLDFHRKLLALEKEFPPESRVWGLIGGSCGLCESCNVLRGRPCARPGEARSSLEAIGISVAVLLGSLRMKLEFRDDVITWTGAILTRDED
jgi:predicted metal-binding protein